jgi:hypothetical protein
MSKQLLSETNGQVQPPAYYSAHIHKLDHKSGTYTMMYEGYYNSSIHEQNQDAWIREQDGTASSLYKSAYCKHPSKSTVYTIWGPGQHSQYSAWMIQGSNPSTDMIFNTSSEHPEWLRGPPYTTRLHPVLRLRMSAAIAPLPHMPSWHIYRDNFTFLYKLMLFLRHVLLDILTYTAKFHQSDTRKDWTGAKLLDIPQKALVKFLQVTFYYCSYTCAAQLIRGGLHLLVQGHHGPLLCFLESS